MPNQAVKHSQKQDRPRRLFFRLRSRMVLIFGSLFFAALLVDVLTFRYGIPFTGYDGEYSQAMEEIGQHLDQHANHIQYGLQDWMRERMEDLYIMSQSPMIISSLETIEPYTRGRVDRKTLIRLHGYEDLQKHLTLLKSVSASYESIMLIRSSTDTVVASTDEAAIGSIVLHYHPTGSSEFLSDGWFSFEHVNSPPGSDELRREYIVATYQIAYMNGTPTDYSLIVRMLLEKEALPRADNTAGDEEVIIFDKDLNVLYDNEFDKPDLAPEIISTLKAMTNVSIEPESVAEMISSPLFKSQPFITVHRRIDLAEELSLNLIMAMDKEYVLASVRARERRMALVGVLTMLAALGLTALVANKLARPISALSSVASSIRSGNLSVRAKVSGADEIAELAMAFNSMVEVVGTWQKELEGKIKERTDEIIRSERYFLALWEEFAALLNSIPDPLMFLEPDLTVRWSNKAASERFIELGKAGMRSSTHCYELIYGKSSPCSCCPALECFSTGSPISTQTITKDGRIWEVRALPVIEDGKVIRVIDHTTDITEKVTSHAERIKSARLASIGSLAAGIAHEVNNPINGIINYAQLMLDEMKAIEGADTSMPERVIKEAKRIETIVKGLLTFSRQREEEHDFTVGAMIEDTVALVRSQLVKDKIELMCNLPPGLPLLHGNIQQMQQVALNLVQNSRHALKALGAKTTRNKLISISAERVNTHGRAYVRIRFRDNGTGIPRSLLDKVMTPFFTTKPSGEGTGLGLSISHEIVSKHGGHMNIISEDGEFTEIIIDIPANSGRLDIS